jgi:hypothetical protein
MGNVISDEEENEFLEEAYALSLDSPDVDKKLNSGTTAPNCQPKHTVDAQDEGLEVAIQDEGDPGTPLDRKEKTISHKHRRGSSLSEHDDRVKRLATSEAERQQKLSYFQMARQGYQELVNAIIRPPRADYKVGYASVMNKWQWSLHNTFLAINPLCSRTLFIITPSLIHAGGVPGTSGLFVLWKALYAN